MSGPLSILIVAAGAFAAGIAVGTLIGSRRSDAPSGQPPDAIFGPLGSAGAVLAPKVALEVLHLIRAESPVAAVKRVCEATGLGLAEAKAVVDDMRRRDAAAR